MNEERAIAIMLANLKTKNKPSNIFEFAQACRFLKERWGLTKMSSFFNVSGYMLRQIDRINDLNQDLKEKVIAENLGIETAYHLSRIKGKDKSKIIPILANMNTNEVRSFVQLLKNNEDITIDQAKQMIEKTRREEIKLLILPLNREFYEKIKQKSDSSNLHIHDFVLKLLEDSI